VELEERKKRVRLGVQLWTTLLLFAISAGSIYSVVRSQRGTAAMMESQRQQQASFQLMRILSHFSRYVLDHKQLPEELRDLVKDSSVRMSERDLVDPWGTPIRYEITEPQPMWFRIGSAGPDRVFGTDDDLVQGVGGKK
jgi:type II secretory pathway pseudopilin PulG